MPPTDQKPIPFDLPFGPITLDWDGHPLTEEGYRSRHSLDFFLHPHRYTFEEHCHGRHTR